MWCNVLETVVLFVIDTISDTGDGVELEKYPVGLTETPITGGGDGDGVGVATGS